MIDSDRQIDENQWTSKQREGLRLRSENVGQTGKCLNVGRKHRL